MMTPKHGRRRAIARSILGLALVCAACGPAPFVVHVLFPGEVEVERGSSVIYQGVTVGRVASVALRQESPQQPARVAVSLEIRDPSVTLRVGDRFHLAERRGLPVIEISPSDGVSPPIPSGASVAGVPPLVSRAEESLAAVVESLSAIALDRLDDLLDEITPPEQGSDDEKRDDATPRVRSAPVAPPPDAPATPAMPATPATPTR